MKIQRDGRRHGGHVIAESALVLSMFLLFMFGIFEYGRFVFLTQVATNAARAGTRYASINMNQPSNFDLVDVSASVPCIKNYVKSQMGGADTMILGFDVSTFPCNPSQLYLDPPVVAPRPTKTAWNAYTDTTVTPNVAAAVSFPDRIGVKIVGSYQPILPVFVFFYSSSGTIPLNITACSGSEG